MLVKFCISENIFYNDKDYFLQVKDIPRAWSFSSSFANIFLFYYETNFIKYNVNFFRYIDDIMVFNCDNFEDISLSIYPKEIVLKNTNSPSFSSFLDLKINFVNNNC